MARRFDRAAPRSRFTRREEFAADTCDMNSSADRDRRSSRQRGNGPARNPTKALPFGMKTLSFDDGNDIIAVELLS
jgi:hypothetical protein